MRHEFRDEASQIIAVTEESGHVRIIEPGMDEWEAALLAGPSPFIPAPTPNPLEVERAGMVVSRLQARGALLLSGKLDEVEALIAGTPETPSRVPPLVRLAWEDASVFRRNSPAIVSVAGLVGLSDENLDDLFRLAATIDV